MWLEADCNLTSVSRWCARSFHGTRYFKEQFGGRTRSLGEDVLVTAPRSADPQMPASNFMTRKSTGTSKPDSADSLYWVGIALQVVTHFITQRRNTKSDHALQQYNASWRPACLGRLEALPG